MASGLFLSLFTACARPAPEPPASTPATPATPEQQESAEGVLPSELVDPDIPPATAGEDGWHYSRSAESDLNGDGTPERVVLTARVEVYDGRPAWDDGQPWQVYVEAVDESRTYLYAQRLQLGTLELRVTSPDEASRPTIVLVEHLPDRLSVYEATYDAPGTATVLTRFQRPLDPRGETASPRFPE